MRNNLIGKTYKSLILGIVATVILNGCNGGSNSGVSTPNQALKSVAKGHMKPLGNDFYLLQPGAGFDSSSNTAVSDQSCLAAANNPANIYIGNPAASVSFGTNEVFGELEKKLGVSLDGAMSGGMFSGSIAASYVQASQDNAYTMNIIYLYQYSGVATFAQGAINQGESALTPDAASLAFGNHPTMFRSMCGDSFVSQMNAGALLGVTISLSFNSNADKEKFKGQLDVNTGIVNIAAAVQQAASSANVNVQMSLNALQFGGDPQNLNQLFGSVSPDGNYSYLDCGSVGGSSQQACNKMIDAVISYAQTLQSQVTNSDGSINLQKMYYTDAVTTPYHNIGVYATAPDPSPDVLAAVRNLTSLYNNANFDLTFSNHYVATLGNYLGTATAMNLKDASYRLNQQINGIFLGTGYNLFKCYRGYIENDCTQIAQNIQTALESAPYALPSYESSEINYLERNSYSAKLYSYDGESTEAPSNYVLQSCMLYPVSSAGNAQFVISCDGDTIFTSNNPNGFTITPAAGVGLSISGLDYNAFNASSPQFAEPIIYPDGLTLNVDPSDPIEFKTQNVSITGGNTFKTTTGIVSLVQVPRSQN